MYPRATIARTFQTKSDWLPFPSLNAYFTRRDTPRGRSLRCHDSNNSIYEGGKHTARLWKATYKECTIKAHINLTLAFTFLKELDFSQITRSRKHQKCYTVLFIFRIKDFTSISQKRFLIY